MTRMHGATPILRIFDEAKTREFYLDFLGFKVDFEHRFGDGMPLYMAVRQDECVLHLSEHYGDSTPGARLRIRVSDIELLAQRLADKNYKFARPGPAMPQPWGERELTVTDPFGNRLTFFEENK